MNKKLASTGTILNKNLTNTESLTLNNFTCENSSLSRCTVDNYIKTRAISCEILDIPTVIPSKLLHGAMYFDTNSKELFIHDGTDWNYVTLTNIPTVP